MADINNYVTGMTGFVYDAKNKVFWITTDSNGLYQLNPETGSGGYQGINKSFGTIDITADGKYLLATSSTTTYDPTTGTYSAQVYRISINSSTYAPYTTLEQTLTFTPSTVMLAMPQIVVAADNNVLVASSDQWQPIRNFEATANVIPAPPVDAKTYYTPGFNKSENGRYILIQENGISNAPFHVYDTTTDKIIASRDFYSAPFFTGGYNSNRGDISEAAGQVALVNGLVNIFDLNLGLVKQFTYSEVPANEVLGAEYSNDGRLLYMWKNSSVLVYETKNWKQVGSFTTNVDLYNAYGSLSRGQMDVTPDERFLFIQLDDGFLTFDLANRLNLTFEGTSGNDALYGSVGTDQFNGKGGNDSYYGGGGRDSVSYIGATSGIYLAMGDGAHWTGEAAGDKLFNIENLTGTFFGDMLALGDGANLLDGSAGSDTLYGQGGDDTLIGGSGADVIIGGDGKDTASYANASFGVYVVVGDGGHWTGEAVGDQLFGIENLTGSAYADVLSLDDNDNVLIGGTGPDSLYGQGGNDTLIGGITADRLDGGSGSDTASYETSKFGVYVVIGDGSRWSNDAVGDTFFSIENVTGSNFDDVLSLDENNNVLDGGAGKDTLFGQGGDDTLIGGDSDGDILVGGAGKDRLVDGQWDFASYQTAASGVYVAIGDGGNWTGDATGDTFVGIKNVIGSDFADVLSMDDGYNQIDGGGGNDTLYGQDGNDILTGGTGGDLLMGGAGYGDTASYATATSGIYLAFGDGGNWTGDATGDTLVGIEGITGSDYADIISMDNGTNTIFGAGGDDILIGNGGADELRGGWGADTFVYRAMTDSTASQRDWIVYMDETDKIDVSAIDASVYNPGDQTFTFVSSFTGHAGEAMLVYDGFNTVLRLDNTGNGQGDFVLAILGEFESTDDIWIL